MNNECMEKFKQINDRLDLIDTKFENFKEFAIQKFNEHDILLKEIHRSVLLSEAYLRDKIPTLFDANTVNQEQHEDFNNKFDNLESSVEHNSLKISILEDTTNLHSEQLRKLTS